MITGIVFDKDGTLIDFNKTWLPRYLSASEWLCQQLVKPSKRAEMQLMLLQQTGYDPERNEWLADSLLASGTNHQIAQEWGEILSVPLEGEILQGFSTRLASEHQPLMPVLDDISRFFRSLRQLGLTLGLATMDDFADAEDTLQQMQSTEYFDFICGADSGFGLKPDPGMINAFCQKTGLAAENVAMVGDSPRDLKMGRNAGAGLVVGVLTGASSEADLAPLADYVLPDIGGLVDIIDSHNSRQ